MSFGADTFKDDSPGLFLLGHDDYSDMGRRIAGLGLPSIVVMEGGNAVDDHGINTVSFIEALAGGGCWCAPRAVYIVDDEQAYSHSSETSQIQCGER